MERRSAARLKPHVAFLRLLTAWFDAGPYVYVYVCMLNKLITSSGDEHCLTSCSIIVVTGRLNVNEVEEEFCFIAANNKCGASFNLTVVF